MDPRSNRRILPFYLIISCQHFSLFCHLLLKVTNNREGGDIGLFITLVPKILYYHFIIRLLNNLAVECLNVLTTNCIIQKVLLGMYIISSNIVLFF